MTWYFYIASFFGGIFLGNAIPHFVAGVSGNKFPSPFAKPSGRGLSSATVNVIWALSNFVVGSLLLRMGQVSFSNISSLIVFFIGVVVISVFSSVHFQKKEREL